MNKHECVAVAVAERGCSHSNGSKYAGAFPFAHLLWTLLWVALFVSDAGAAEPEPGTPPASATISTPRSVANSPLASSAILEELKGRGLNPLLPSAPKDLRAAFVNYDYATGGGHNFQAQASTSTIRELNAAMAKTAITSLVKARTKQPGARIKYKLIEGQSVLAFGRLTNDAEETMPIGLYQIWAERQGQATSTPETFRIITPTFVVDLDETSK